MKKAVYKVPDGKLLKIFLETDGGRISEIKITGDFFVHPEARIEELEEVLAGCELTEEVLKEKLEEFFDKNKTELFGVDIPSLVHTILMAL